ncbi:30S ribosomal protein S15 [Candidatus Micrarchaeota archaeon]|nr:30S ribosomal protein S15 [Candidatus Micrarchaeota archaeon]
MARLHSKKHGKSGRKRPKAKIAPKWIDYSEKEVKEIILQLIKKGTSATAIGLILRDQYAVPSVKALIGKTINQYLEEEGVLPEYPDDLLNLIRKAVVVRNHLKSNKTDVHNKVKLLHIESKIQRLAKYYRKTSRIPKDWKYNADNAALLIK